MDARKANAAKGRSPLRPSRGLRAALKKRGRHVGTISYFYSAKNDVDMVLPTDLELCHALLAEVDEEVERFDTDPERVIAFADGEGYSGSKPDAIVRRRSGRYVFREVKYKADQSLQHSLLQAQVQREAAAAVGADWEWFSEDDVLARDRLLHDALHIAVVLFQCQPEFRAQREFLESLVLDAVGAGTTLRHLRRAAQRWDLVFATAFQLVFKGVLRSDLAARPLSPDTRLEPRGVRS